MAKKYSQLFNILLTYLLLASCGQGTQESCKAQAAKEANSNEALAILVAECERKFPAIQSEDGTFRIYVSELGKVVEVSSATLNKTDRDKIKRLIEEQNIQNEIDNKNRSKRLAEAQRGFSVISSRISCTNRIAGDCYDYSGVFTAKNNSPYKITSVFFGYAIGAGLDCRGVQNFGSTIDIPIWPGQTVTHSFEIPLVSDRSGKGCAKLSVNEVE